MQDPDNIFSAVNGDFKKGCLVAVIETYSFSFSILEFITLENNDKYLLGRVGAYS
jgi:hypothetical protein